MSWGNRLLITFIVFGVGMLYLVYRATTTTFELVEPDYYNQELKYQQVLDASERSKQQGQVVVIAQSDSIRMNWPESIQGKSIQGEAWFYCAYDQKRDRKIPIETRTGTQQVGRKELFAGNYTVKLSWTDGVDRYYQETPLSISE